MANPEGTADLLERAIGALTRRLGTAPDDEISELVAERRAMRAELEELRRTLAGNVISLDPRRPR